MDEDLRYIHHFGLIAPPFQGIPDRRFIWLGDKQLETLAHLKVGIEGGKGVLLLLGDEGSGKSVLLGCLLPIVAGEIATAILREAWISVDRFFNFLAAEFKIDKEISTKGDFLAHFRTFLLAASSEGRKVLLVVEDAQNQEDEILEQVRLFSNMEENGEKLLSVLLIGNSELNEKLMEHRHRALLQRVAVRRHVDPLSEKETGAYIQHRMMVGGAFLEIFTREAVREFTAFGWHPEMIDLICDHALMSGYFEKRRTIDGKLLTRYAKESKKTFRLEKGAGLSFEGAAHPKADAVNAGKSRFPKATSIGIGLAVFLLLTAGISYLNFHEEKPPTVAVPPPRSAYTLSPPPPVSPATRPPNWTGLSTSSSKTPRPGSPSKGTPILRDLKNTTSELPNPGLTLQRITWQKEAWQPARIQAVGMGAANGF